MLESAAHQKYLYVQSIKVTEMVDYVEPNDVTAPRGRWKLIDVLIDKGENGYALAIGEFDGVRRLGMRWNGTADSPKEHPQSRHPVWFMLPADFHTAVIESMPVQSLPENKKIIARALLGI